jgi:hypothetical protein
VTTRRRNLWGLNGLGRRLGTRAARFLCLGMFRFGGSILAMPCLPLCRLPAED